MILYVIRFQWTGDTIKTAIRGVDRRTKNNMGKISDRIGRRWRESVDKVKEYEITKEDKVIETEFIPSYIVDFEYREAQKLKQKLLERYRGKDIEDVLNGEVIRTKMGACYHLSYHDEVDLTKPDPEEIRRRILSDLKLIYGIREVTERRLKEEGYKTIEDLAEHPRFGNKAKEFLNIFNKYDICNIIDWIGQRCPKSHPLMLYASGLYDKEDFVFLDIETLGLFTRPIILFGIAHISEDRMLINQYLLRDISEETGALAATLSHFRENIALVTFNGRTFDIPYMRERVAYYRMRADIEKFNVDLLHFSRRAWKERLPNCRLTTLEKYLFGLKRRGDVPNTLVPEFYETYLITKNPGPLVPIIEHNKQDLITLANIFSRLWEEWL